MAIKKLKATIRESPVDGETQAPPTHIAKPSEGLKVGHAARNHSTGPDMFIKHLQDYYDSLDGLFTDRR